MKDTKDILLLELTQKFLSDFISLYQTEDKTATESYVTNIILPEVLNAALPYNSSNESQPLCSGGFMVEMIKESFQKYTQNLPLKINWLVKNHHKINDDQFRICNIQETTKEKDNFDFTTNPTTKTKILVRVVRFTIKNTKNNFNNDIEVEYNKNGEIYEVRLFGKIYDFPICTITSWYDHVESKINGFGDNNILDINSFCYIINTLYNESNG